MAQHNPTWVTALRRASALIWKWSVPVSHTDPVRIATKIGNALFPGLALRISQFVTLRQSKAPITVCESALRRCPPPGKHFRLETNSLSNLFSLDGFIALQRIPAGACRVGPRWPNPTCRLSGSRRRSGCIPAEPYPPLEQENLSQQLVASNMNT